MKSSTALASVLSAFLLGGCMSGPPARPAASSSNVYSAKTHLPAGLRRVAVLPLTCDDSPEVETGRDTLQSVLVAELIKTSAFEVTPVSREQLRAATGRSEWTADEVLPSDFCSHVRAITGCDAVLFCRLRQFRAYPPLIVGWDLKLVDASQCSVLWAVDEVFDSGKPAVASAAQGYYARAIGRGTLAGDPEMIMMSPRLFGQYAAASSLEALPAR